MKKTIFEKMEFEKEMITFNEAISYNKLLDLYGTGTNSLKKLSHFRVKIRDGEKMFIFFISMPGINALSDLLKDIFIIDYINFLVFQSEILKEIAVNDSLGKHAWIAGINAENAKRYMTEDFYNDYDLFLKDILFFSCNEIEAKNILNFTDSLKIFTGETEYNNIVKKVVKQ